MSGARFHGRDAPWKFSTLVSTRHDKANHIAATDEFESAVQCDSLHKVASLMMEVCVAECALALSPRLV